MSDDDQTGAAGRAWLTRASLGMSPPPVDEVYQILQEHRRELTALTEQQSQFYAALTCRDYAACTDRRRGNGA